MLGAMNIRSHGNEKQGTFQEKKSKIKDTWWWEDDKEHLVVVRGPMGI